MTLSILICSIFSRATMLDLLLQNLEAQLEPYNGNIYVITDEQEAVNISSSDKVQIIVRMDDKEMSIGAKRQWLLEKAACDYVVFIDDDDQISDRYVKLIMDAAQSKPDCIGIQGTMTIDGKDLRQWYISSDYTEWYEKDRIYYRTPNHISPVKKQLALLAGFENISWQEDLTYSNVLRPFLKTEVKITENIYHYAYISKK